MKLKSPLILLQLLMTGICFSQTIFPYNACENFDWSTVEIKTSSTDWETFINSVAKGRFFESYPIHSDEFPDFTHPIDLNNDGERDFIYNGLYSAEGLLIEFYLSLGVSYKSIFTETGHFCRLEFKNNIIKRCISLNRVAARTLQQP